MTCYKGPQMSENSRTIVLYCSKPWLPCLLESALRIYSYLSNTDTKLSPFRDSQVLNKGSEKTLALWKKKYFLRPLLAPANGRIRRSGELTSPVGCPQRQPSFSTCPVFASPDLIHQDSHGIPARRVVGFDSDQPLLRVTVLASRLLPG